MSSLRLVFILTIFHSFGCSSSKKDYLNGRWIMPQDDHTMIFEKDSLLSWIMPGSLTMDTFKAVYKYNESHTPHHLDFYNFEKGILVDKVLTGILEIHGSDSATIDFESADSWDEVDSLRPKNFSDEQKRVIVRIKR